MIGIIYTEYPDEIKINQYYFTRTKENLNLRVIRIYKLVSKNLYLGMADFIEELQVKKEDLLIFDPTSRLFKHLMDIKEYRISKLIRRVLIEMSFDANKFMQSPNQAVAKYNHILKMTEFIDEYSKFSGEFACNYFNSVPGTMDLTVYELYKKVILAGGYERVTNDQRWKRLFYNSMPKTNVSYALRTFYKKYLYEFENRYEENNGCLDFGYRYKIHETILIKKYEDSFIGRVKLRRNRGLNQYYIQFDSTTSEFSEWFCEDLILKFHLDSKYSLLNKYIRKSSKTNYLFDDPLTREKHSHLGRKNSVQILNNFGNNSALPMADSNYEKKELSNPQDAAFNAAVRSVYDIICFSEEIDKEEGNVFKGKYNYIHEYIKEHGGYDDQIAVNDGNVEKTQDSDSSTKSKEKVGTKMKRLTEFNYQVLDKYN